MADLLLDVSVFAQFYDLWGEEAGDVIRELIEMFLKNTPGMIEEMGRALEAGNAKELRRLAHTLKSNAGTLGAMRLSSACRQLEALADAGNLDEARQVYERVRSEYASAEEALRLYLQTLSETAL